MSKFIYTEAMVKEAIDMANIIVVKSAKDAKNESAMAASKISCRGFYDFVDDTIYLNGSKNPLYLVTAGVQGGIKFTAAHELLHWVQVKNFAPNSTVVDNKFHYEMELDAHALELAFSNEWTFPVREYLALDALTAQYGFSWKLLKTRDSITEELNERVKYFRDNLDIFKPLFSVV